MQLRGLLQDLHAPVMKRAGVLVIDMDPISCFGLPLLTVYCIGSTAGSSCR